MPLRIVEKPANRAPRSSVLSGREPPATRSPPSQPQAGPSRKRRRATDDSQRASIKSSPSSPGPPPETQFESQNSGELWDAIEILDERGQPGSGQYLIRWEGLDPDTGEPWEPTWERRRDVTMGLAAEWKIRKMADPSIIGIEGKKFHDSTKARLAAEKKRRREEKQVKAKKARRSKCQSES